MLHGDGPGMALLPTGRLPIAQGACMSAVPPASDLPVDRILAMPRGGPTVLRMMLGAQLRRLREARGISREDAGYEIRASRSKISRLEHGRVGFKERDVTDLLALYGVDDEQELAALTSLAERANAAGWWARYHDIMPDWFEIYIGLEQAASLMRSYELQFVPGLFQTEDYARAVTILGHRSAPAEEIDRRVALRRARQELLTSSAPPTVWTVVDEAALRRPIGGPEVMRGQLEHLIEISELQNVVLQVVPFRHGGHAAAGGAFTILRFAEHDLPDVVYLEQLTSAVYLDRREDTDHYMEVMDRLSAEAEPPTDTASLLGKIIKAI
jgi:transcriptional regulator with XRE-family HTH domain